VYSTVIGARRRIGAYDAMCLALANTIGLYHNVKGTTSLCNHQARDMVHSNLGR
jgi:hypothetical protein